LNEIERNLSCHIDKFCSVSLTLSMNNLGFGKFHSLNETCFEKKSVTAAESKHRKMHIAVTWLGWLSGSVFTTLHFLSNLRMDSTSWPVCHWQAFPAWYNV